MEAGSPGQLRRLPSSTVRLISSAQVITSVSSVVKELMENSLDAGASCIEVHLDCFGLDRIEVRDNGHGIEEEDVHFMCRRSYTSKISNFSDLEKLNSYGFRGEALFSVCSVADVSVTTITEGRPYAKTYKFNHDGEVMEAKPANLERGTIITVTNLFKNLPVRKQFLTSGKRKQEEIKRVEMVVKTLALVNCEVKTRLFHNKFTIFQKASVCSITRSLIQILPSSLVKQLQEINYEHSEDRIKFTLLVPKQECNIVTTCLGHSLEATYLFINSRPVREKQLEKAMQEKVFGFFGSRIPAKKYPAMLASIILPPDMVDVNLEPNKTVVMVRDIEKLIKLLRDELSTYYYGMDEETMMIEAINADPPKRKICSSQSPVPTKKIRKMGENHTDPPETSLHASNGELAAPNMSQDSQSNVRNGEVSSALSIFDPPCVSTLEVKPSEVVSQLEETSTESKDALISAFIDGLEQVPLSSPSPKESDGEVVADVCQPIVTEDPFDLLRKPRTPRKLNPDQLEESEFFSQPNPVVENMKDASLEGDSKDSIENGDSNHKTDFEPFSLTQWSKGVVLVDGRKLEGTTVVAGHSSVEESSGQLSESSIDDSNRSERSVSSQMGQKDMSAFTKFAREMRKEIVKAEPGISFPKIAKELSKRWQDLQDADKQLYKEKALADKQEKKKRRSTDADSPKVNPPRRNSSEMSRPKFVKVYPSLIRVNITLENIREAIRRRNAPDVVQEAAAIISDLNEDLSLVKEPSAVFALSCHRLNEAIKFYNNLNHMILDLKVLEKGIEIRQEEFGSLWDTLDRLNSSMVVNDLQADRLHSANVLVDERITKNGFRIEKMECSTGNSYTITDIAKNIPLYGLYELKEILECIAKDEQCKLRSCRPLKAINFIRSETARSLTGQDFTRTDYTINLYQHWRKKIRPNFEQCPHHQPVTEKIFP